MAESEGYFVLDEEALRFVESVTGQGAHEGVGAGHGSGIIAYSLLGIERVEWTIPGLVPRGMLTVLAGEQGLGKSLLHAAWAAQLSRQEQATIIISAEDSPTHTTKARLQASQADESRIFHATILPVLGNGKDPEWLAKIQEWITVSQARLVVFDPLSAFIAAQTDSYKDQHVRIVLSALDEVARATESSIVYVMHLTKGLGTNPMQRIAGSIAFTAAARSVVLLAPETTPQENGRILAHVKCNVAEKALPQRWEIEPMLIPASDGGADYRTARIAYKGLADVDPWQLLAQPVSDDEKDERDRACDLILSLLADGDMASADLRRALEAHDVSPRTAERARKALGVEAFQRDRKWFLRVSATVTSQTANAQTANGGWRSGKPAPLSAKEGGQEVQTASSESGGLSDTNLGTASLDVLQSLFPPPPPLDTP